MAEEMLVHNITIMKYYIGGRYEFKVLDKFDEPDEVKRLDKMIAISKEYSEKLGGLYRQVWIKESVII